MNQIQEALDAGYSLMQVQMIQEAKASSELEGAKTDKTLLELLRMAP